MEKSTLYNLIEHKLLHRWRNEIESAEDFAFAQQENNAAAELKSALGDKEQGLIGAYCREVENRMDELHLNIGIKILNLGVQIGMEIQQAIIDQNE